MIAAAAKAVRKVKQPPLPADPQGARFCQYFNHPWNFIVAPVPEPGRSPSWRTENRYPLQPRNLWELYKNPDILVGLRFGHKTSYALIDIDRGSPYHPENNPQNFRLVLQAAEEIGLCRYTLIQSSDSGGLHVYFFLPEPVPSFGVACALKFALLDGGCQLKQGELELFPNVKAYNKNRPTDYNGHRLPLQAGSWLLDANLQPVTNDIETFLDWADFDAAQQDMEVLLDAIATATARQKATSYNRSALGKAQEWKQHLEERIAQGWTEPAQTNDLLKDIVCYGKVWVALSGQKLIDYVVTTATNAPGYSEFCQHQHEIRQRAAEWVHSTEANQFYTPYCSIPLRLATYRETYSDVPNPGAANDVIPFRNPINEERRAQAHERIKNAIAQLEATNILPYAATARAKALVATIKELTGVRVSHKTLYKDSYLVLWHPKFNGKGCGINAPEQDAADSVESGFAQEATSAKLIESKEASLLEDSQEIPTPPPYMKVFDELSAPDAPQGHQGAAQLNPEKGGYGGDFAASEEVVAHLGVPNSDCVTPTAAVENSLAPDVAQTNGEIDFPALVESEAFIPTEATSEPTAFPVEDSVTVATEPATFLTTEVASEPPIDFWRINKIRLEAVIKAQREVRWQAGEAGRRLTWEERKRKETLVKMQIQWMSGERVLMDEVTAWANETDGVVMTSDGPMWVDELESPPQEKEPSTIVSEPAGVYRLCDNETDSCEEEISSELAAKIAEKMAAEEYLLLNADQGSFKALDYDEADHLGSPDPSWFVPPDEDDTADTEDDNEAYLDYSEYLGTPDPNWFAPPDWENDFATGSDPGDDLRSPDAQPATSDSTLLSEKAVKVDVETPSAEPPTKDILLQYDQAERLGSESPDAFPNSSPFDNNPPFPAVGDVVWRNPCERYRKGMKCRIVEVRSSGAWTDNNWHISVYAWEKGWFVPYDPQRHQSH